ncbi:MAG TPA: S8 family serine peptidase [Candidatus Kapabacteria bacterium]|nr:S8 family serine peptidase [Candidatus Kapabacteria bacterium]
MNDGISRITYFWVVIFLVLALADTTSSFGGQRYWIYFRDKGPESGEPLYKNVARYTTAMQQVTERSLRRRAKVLPQNALVDEQDVPLYKPYEDSLRAEGIQPVNELRWFNAVTAELTAQQIQQVQNLPFVKNVTPVKTLYFKNDPLIKHSGAQTLSALSHTSIADSTDSLDYGSSYSQLQQIQIPELQSLGITGSDVLLGMLDTGFRWRYCLSTRTADVWHEYDFIFHDTVTANQPGDDPGQDTHGTGTFSEVCGYAPGDLLGGAFNASFLLAKTEDIRSEKHIEEDNYANALQWMDSLGVDVTSSSLGYSIFDSGQGSYTYADMNGHTTIVAQAVERAVKVGIVVVTAAGNEGENPSWPYIISPGDADTAITVGAVDSTGTLAGFSSRGPTSDGRIKPDVCAQGVQNTAASVDDSSLYFGFTGTSASTPLVGASVALILSAHPGLTPLQVRNALHATASQSNAPDTAYGWGIERALDAALSFGMIFSNPPRIVLDSASGNNAIITGIKASDGVQSGSAQVFYSLDHSKNFKSLNLTHIINTDLYFARFPQFPPHDTVEYYVQAVSGGGVTATAPYNALQSLFSFVVGDTTVFRKSPISEDINGINFVKEPIPSNYFLAQNYPSPFNATTAISFGVATPQNVTIDAFNILGKKVVAIYNGNVYGTMTVQWNAAGVPSGVYIIRMSSPAFNAVMFTMHKN